MLGLVVSKIKWLKINFNVQKMGDTMNEYSRIRQKEEDDKDGARVDGHSDSPKKGKRHVPW